VPAAQPDDQVGQQPASEEAIDRPENQPPDARQADERAAPDGEPQSPTSPAEQEGAELGVLTAPSPGGGVLVQRIDPASAAARAGIAPGDYILSVNGQQTTDPNELRAQIDQFAPGQQVQIEVWRNGQRREVDVTLGRPHATGYRGEPREEQASQDWLGVALGRADDGEGVQITDIHPAGPAAFAGLRPGDVVQRIDEEPVASPEDVTQAIAKRRPGSDVQLTILRDGQQQTLQTALRTRPQYLGATNRYEGRYEEDEDYSDWTDESMAPEHSMMLEQHRHFAQQHQRIENLLNDLVQEVQTLRQEVRQLQRSGRADEPTSTAEPTGP
jgi:membrane-associated protease RseP (regulator of RpoE activity)